MKGSIGKWGNCLAIRLPKSVAEEAHFSEGDQVDFEIQSGKLILTPTRPSFTLEELMAAYDPARHHHEEVDWGPPVGTEIW